MRVVMVAEYDVPEDAVEVTMRSFCEAVARPEVDGPRLYGAIKGDADRIVELLAAPTIKAPS